MTGEELFQFAARQAREQFQANGPRPCCGEYGIAIEVLGEPTEYYCSVCHRRWTEPLPFQPAFLEVLE